MTTTTTETPTATRGPAAQITREAAVASLGPPPNSYYVIGGLVGLLTMFGLVMVMSASSVRLFHQGASPWFYFARQLMWATFGMIAMVTTMRVPYDRWRTWVLPALIVSYVLMLLPFVPGLGFERERCPRVGAARSVRLSAVRVPQALGAPVLRRPPHQTPRPHAPRSSHVVAVPRRARRRRAGSCSRRATSARRSCSVAIVLAVVFIGGAP